MNTNLTGLGPGGLERVANHGTELVHAPENCLQVIALFGGDVTRQAIH
ncbi:MAG TPA: hypothetical protein VL983_04430 [Terriglobales bacterium]|nr:hypothetical protein [Terriglobales bacterium]